MINMRTNKAYMVAIMLIALSAVIGLTQLKTPNPAEQTPDLPSEVIYSDSFLPSEDKQILVKAIPDNVTAYPSQAAMPSTVLELTTEQVIEEADLVAFVVITSKGTSFSKYPAIPISVYNASVKSVVKGSKIEGEIHLIVYEGYLKEDEFVRLEEEPDFKVGDEWLLFMNARNYVKSLDMYLLKDSYRPRFLTNVKVVDGKLSVLSKAIVSKLGIDGLSSDEFIQRYGS